MSDLANQIELRRRLAVSAVLELWKRGFDTWQIAKTLGDDQAGIERLLHEGLEIERRERYARKNS